jgi:hypothetical protein
MTDFHEQDLAGSRFQKVDLSEATFTQVRLNGARLRDVDLTGVDVRAAYLEGARLRGVELVDVEVYGELQNVSVNGVDIGPLVEAELNRRMPERAKMNPRDPDGFKEAWEVLERLWQGTVERASALPEELLHRNVDDEWSFIQTLRHLSFATATWVDRTVLGNPSPWHPLDLPWDEAPGWEGVPWDREVRPSLDEALALRARRQATVREVIGSLTDERLGSEVRPVGPGGPDESRTFTVAECLRVVLVEEWEHRLYAERDLVVLEKES